MPAPAVLCAAILALAFSLSAAPQTLRYTESFEVFPNPERGWIAHRSLDDVWGLEELRASSECISIILIKVDIGGSKNLDHISPATIDSLRSVLAACRTQGLKALFRAAYIWTDANAPEPASLDRLLGHIADFSPTFHDYADVLLACEAGFLGPWGEWHSSQFSTNTSAPYYPISAAAAQAVHAAFLAALPDNRQLIIRRPSYIRSICGSTAPLADADAYGTSALARSGYHNDAYLSDETESGTFSDGWTREQELTWIEQATRNVFFGGESFGTPGGSYNNGPAAYTDSRRQHMSYINRDYQTSIYAAWGDSIKTLFSKKLGYRFVLDSMTYSGECATGDSAHFQIRLHNAGFSSPHLPRPVVLILSREGSEVRFPLAADPRLWKRESGSTAIDAAVLLPDTLSAGTWTVALALPDPSPLLAADPRYAVRFANAAVWDSARGITILGDIQVLAPVSLRNPSSTRTAGKSLERSMIGGDFIILDRKSLRTASSVDVFTVSGQLLAHREIGEIENGRVLLLGRYRGMGLVRYNGTGNHD